MGRLYRIKRDVLIKTVVCTLLNVYDFNMAIEGGTGISKSTLAIHLANGVKHEFKRLLNLKPETVEYYYEKIIKRQGISIEDFVKYLLELKKNLAYNFTMEKDLIYDHNAMKEGLTSWNRIIIPDEAVLLSHNRDFSGTEQKNIVKLMNVMRDHRNFMIMCIPHFNTLDVQVRNLIKMRISVIKRGVGIIQTPHALHHGKDMWDSATNEKIEREWLLKGGKPKYSKITTAKGIVTYPKLAKGIEKEYQRIKNLRRGTVVSKDLGLNVEKKKEPFDLFYERLLSGGIRNSNVVEGFAMSIGIDAESLRSKLQRKLRRDGKQDRLSYYYWDKKAKKTDADFKNDFKDSLRAMEIAN